MDERETKKTRTAMYLNQLISYLGNGLASPFIPYYAAYLEFNSEEIGFIQAILNFVPNFFQYVWGILSDLIRKRIIFLIIGGIINYVMFSAFIFTRSFFYFIIVLIIQALFSAMVPPAWNAMIGELSTKNNKSMFIANLSFYSNIASLISLVFFMIYAYHNVNATFIVFYYSFYAATVLGTIAYLILLYASEPKYKEKLKFKQSEKLNKDFIRFSVAISIYNFFMSLSWPLFYITTVDVLKANVFEVGMINFMSVLFTVLFLRYFGKLTDKLGSKRIMIMSRILFFPVPLLYGISTNVYDLYWINALTGVGTAMSNVSLTSYLVEKTSPKNRGKATGVYNAMIGSVTFFGSIIGGISAQALEGVYSLAISLFIVYIISTIGRMGSISFFLKLN